MKKGKLLHPELAQLIAEIGHGQALSIADAGLPIGAETPRIDLALTKGEPGFLKTLDVVLSEMQVEQVIIAEEMANTSPELYSSLIQRIEQLSEEQGCTVSIQQVSHHSFKQQSDHSLAIVRTGEFTPYANIILKSGVVF